MVMVYGWQCTSWIDESKQFPDKTVSILRVFGDATVVRVHDVQITRFIRAGFPSDAGKQKHLPLRLIQDGVASIAHFFIKVATHFR